MNLYSGSTVSSLMKPLFWKRMSPMNFYANYQRQLFLSKSTLKIQTTRANLIMTLFYSDCITC